MTKQRPSVKRLRRARIQRNLDVQQKRRYGWFSQQAKDTHHQTSIYTTPDGEEVEIGTVSNTNDPDESLYSWPDKVCVGEVTEWLRDGQKEGVDEHRKTGS